VVRIGEAAQPKGEGRVRAKIVRVKIEVPDAMTLLKPGMEVDIETTMDIKQNALLVPADAVIEEPQGEYVYVLQGAKAYKRAVKTGFSSYTQTEIISGLQPGELVVVSGKDDLSDGVPVSAHNAEQSREGRLEAGP